MPKIQPISTGLRRHRLTLSSILWGLLTMSITAPIAAIEPVTDLAVADQDPDFRVQGEYVGQSDAMQVIALGRGDFEIVVFAGGLPDGSPPPTPPRRIEVDAAEVAELIASKALKRIERVSPTLGEPPPPGAIVLFDGTRESLRQHWNQGKIVDDELLAAGATTSGVFSDYSLHVEFQTPWMPAETGQARGNSGIYHQGRYETQVLDSFGLEGESNQTGGIYAVAKPTANLCYPPLRWQTYDVEFTAADYRNGEKVTDAKLTVRLNGVMVQNAVSVSGPTRAAPAAEGPRPGPIVLQDHGDPVRFRNIWLVPRDADREARRPIVPGFERFFARQSNPPIDGGELLISSLACDACHALDRPTGIPTQRGPSLVDVNDRVRVDAMVNMIASPHDTKAGTTMPDPWSGMSDEQRQRRATAITNYLVSQGDAVLSRRTVAPSFADAGETYYHTLGCVACHPAGQGHRAAPSSTSVPLGNLGEKYSVSSLAKFLMRPHDVRPGLRMPALTGSPAEAMAIAAYLTGDANNGLPTGTFNRQIYEGRWQSLPDFDSLTPVASDVVIGLQIDDLPSAFAGAVYTTTIKIEHDGLYHFRMTSDDGSSVRIDGNRLAIDGLHPAETQEASYRLNAGQYPIRVEYFNGGGELALGLRVAGPSPEKPSSGLYQDIGYWIENQSPEDEKGAPTDFKFDPNLVDEGQRWFVQTGCASCHAVREGSAAMPAIALADADVTHGCLAQSVSSPAVDYQLSPTQQSALRAAIKARQGTIGQTNPDKASGDQQSLVHLTMAALNCYACHDRGDIGGPEPSRNVYFETATPEMGNEGRLPPMLTGVGDKLNVQYLTEVLDRGANARDYMLTRMPAYHAGFLNEFKQAIVQLDRREQSQPASHTDSLPDIIAAGREVCGSTGLSCIKCHRFGDQKGGGIGAIDMLQMPRRLRESWFHRYLRDPAGYRPGTRMPNSFVDGKSAFVDSYDGDPALQIDAMWQYLLQGRDAKEPEGLRPGAIVLTPIDRPLIYRNFMSDASPRGIAVGYPQEVNLLWDAQRMGLIKVWRNRFVDASPHWRGRGQAAQSPRGDSVVMIESQTPFALLPSLEASWPGEENFNPPHRFNGYRLDSAGHPIFSFHVGRYRVVDQLIPLVGDSVGFGRTLIITPEPGETSSGNRLVWRPATGQIKNAADPNTYRVDDRYDLRISGVNPQIASFGDPPRSNALELRVLIDDVHPTTIEQTIQW